MNLKQLNRHHKNVSTIVWGIGCFEPQGNLPIIRNAVLLIKSNCEENLFCKTHEQNIAFKAINNGIYKLYNGI